MALYHFSMKLCSRGKGHSAAGMCAYILGERKHDAYTGRVYDHSYRNDIAYREVMLPDCAPQDFVDAQVLLNAANAAERRCDARLGWAFDIALPRELDLVTHISMIQEFAADHFTVKGCAVIAAIHAGKAKERTLALEERCDNPHVHLLVFSRPLNRDGFQPTKSASRCMNRKDTLIHWRESWARLLNRELERHGFRDRMVSHESLARQGIDRDPTIHLGAGTLALQARGIRTQRYERYQDILQRNQERTRQEALERLRQAELEREYTRSR